MLRQKFEANDLFNIVSVACISQRRNVLFTANPLQAWALVEGAIVPRISFPKPTRCMCLSTDERTIAVASGSAVSVIDVDTATEIRTLAGHVGNINTIAAFNKNVYCWATGGDDGQCILWNVAAHPPNVMRIRTQTTITALALSPDDRFCVVGTDMSLEIYDLRQRAAKVKHAPGISVHGVSFHPREFLLSTFGGDRVVRFWDLETFECIGVSDEVDDEIKKVSFAPNGDLLIACTDESLHLVTWEPVTEVARSDLPPEAKVVSVLPTPDSLEILCAFANRSIGLFNTTYEEILASETSELAVEDIDPFDEIFGEGKLSSISSPLSDGSDGIEGVITPISEGCTPEEEHQPIPIGLKDETLEAVHRAVSTSRLQDTPQSTKPMPSKRAETLVKRSASRSTSSLISMEMAKSSTSQRADTPDDPHPIAKTGNRSASIKKSLPLPDMRPRNASTGKLTEKKMNTIPRNDRSVSVSDRKTQSIPPKEITRTNSVKSKNNNGKEPESLSDVFNAITASHNDSMRKLEDNKRDITSLMDLIRRRGIIQAFELLDGNKRELALLISALSSEGNQWTISLASKVLPRLRLLSSGGASPTTSQFNRSIIAIALSQIVAQVGDRMKECARAPSSRIGVDVAAEERQQQAQKCLQALMELRINGSFLSDKLPPEEKKTFEKTLNRIDDLCKD
ncbi:unnamed protein product, partial [Mesorhabditis belari]|uniref:Katanin p80 subunit C-terminal domain-containing protein n=1 Tax=Mesorhabditis belari TaxID=2138241 RepID=A0AAF3J2W4_9BILA